MYDCENEPLVISKSLIDLFRKEDNTGDLIALYTFYYYTAKWQCTNTARATTAYTAEGLDWTEARVKKNKKVLLDIGLIEDRQQRNSHNRITGHFVYVRFMWSDGKVKELQEHLNSTHTNLGGVESNSTHTFLQGVEKRTPNALSVNKGNALSANNTRGAFSGKQTSIPTYLDKFPPTYQKDPKFVEAWTSFVLDRKESKHPVTERSALIVANKLSTSCAGDILWATESVNASIEAGYRGVFVSNKKPQNNTPQQQNKSTDMNNYRKGPRVGCDPHGR